jgi:predicted ArsR family transcriptional regulator
MPSPIRDEKSLDRLQEKLAKKAMTIPQIAAQFQVSERTAYRWLDYLMDRGLLVVKLEERKNGRVQFEVS